MKINEKERLEEIKKIGDVEQKNNRMYDNDDQSSAKSVELIRKSVKAEGLEKPSIGLTWRRGRNDVESTNRT